MRERNKKKLIYSSNSEKARKAFQKFEAKFESEQVRKKYIERKRNDTDTIERKDIHAEIKRLMNYGFPEEETVAKLKKVFPDSKYQMFFGNWVKDQYGRKKPNSSSREDDLSL